MSLAALHKARQLAYSGFRNAIQEPNMYRAIVARKVRGTFRALSSGDASALTDQLASSFEYRFVGEHALGGVRTSIDEMNEWFARVFRLFPGLRFEVGDVAVTGMPWNTVVLTRAVVLAEGYRNEMFQRIGLSWGKVVNVVTLEDNQLLETYLQALSVQGRVEATEPPIDSTRAP